MRVLIVDGYNVIRSTPPYSHLAESDDLDSARAALVSDVAAYAHGDWRATIVFDGGGNPHSDGLPHDVAGVAVVFSKHGLDADSVIERLARSARESGDQVVVVTSDAQMQWAVMGGSVSRMSASGFAEELGTEGREWLDHAPSGSASGLLEDRVPADVRRRLSKWARGEETPDRPSDGEYRE